MLDHEPDTHDTTAQEPPAQPLVAVLGTEITVTARSGGKSKPTSAFAALG